MRWYGWGAEGTGFDLEGRPYLIPYAVAALGIDPKLPQQRPPDPDTLTLPSSRLSDEQWRALAEVLPEERMLSRGHHDRLLHAYGRGTRDIWRLRHGWIDWAPDAVAFPTEEAHLVALVTVAAHSGVALIPFGGGSNVAGCLEALPGAVRPTLTVNMRRMNRLIELDEVSGLACVQAGMLGPDLEAALQPRGFTFGHLPDSFHHSTVGGWVSTRSSGMLSDGYGNAEDRVMAVRLITPSGIVASRPVPHSSAGPDVNRLIAGSEGALGILSEVTLSVRRLPERQASGAMLFRSFEAGINALRQAREVGIVPVASRLNDPHKTQLSAAFRRVSIRSRLIGPVAKAVLRRLHGLDLESVSLMINVYEGTAHSAARQRREAERIYRCNGAVQVGSGPARATLKSKFDLPHIRDFMMARRVITDVAETCLPWAEVPDMYRSGREVLERALTRGGRRVWIGVHVSHTYPAGCSIYFTFAFHCLTDATGRYEPARELAHYLSAKEAILEHFCAAGGAISHHHAVGQEHLPWLAREVEFGRGSVIEAVKASVDPLGIMNPGRHVTGAARPLSEAMPRGVDLQSGEGPRPIVKFVSAAVAE
jgi:alkyldihydroxyacetonephosphate synthase